MKYIIIINLTALFLIGCGTDNSNKKKLATSPTSATAAPAAPAAVVVRLKAQNMGNVQYIDFGVRLPSGTKKNLLDYNGKAKLVGTIQTTFPCASTKKTFTCDAQLGVGNINASSCSVGGHTISMLIVLTRGDEVKETYNILSIIAQAPLSCFQANNN